jgi:hypothetical protein
MAYITLPVNFFRLYSEPLDTTSVFTAYEELTSYAATSPVAYSGQICSVKDQGVYFLNTDKTVTKLNAGATTISKQYLTDYVGESAIYTGSAVQGSSITSPVWTIKKSIFSLAGTFISSISAVNIPWSSRFTL